MSPSVVNALSFLWLGGSLFAFLFALGCLVHAIAGWSGPYRNRRLLRFGIGLIAIPALFAAYVALYFWGVIIPADRRRVEREAVDAMSLVHVGNLATTFSLKDVAGREFSLDSRESRDLEFLSDVVWTLRGRNAKPAGDLGRKWRSK